MNTNEDQNGQLLLAQRYATGELEPECDDEAFQLCKLVGERGGAKVVYFVGECYFYGWSTDKDLKAAVQCYVRAAELGSYEALQRLQDLRNDRSVKANLQSAFRDFCKKADQGDIRAQFNVGFCHFHGIGIPRDSAKARDLFQMAADRGCADAMWMLERCRQDCVGDGYNGMQGIGLLKYAAKLGSAKAQYELRCAYFEGRITYGLEVEKDYEQEAEWFQNAVDQNYAGATHILAWCYCNGEGVQKDVKNAFQLWKKAALMGYGSAQVIISDFYRHGYFNLSEDEYPVDVDYYEAAYWNRKAVDQHYYSAKKSMPDVLKSIGLTQKQIKKLKQQTSSFESAKTWHEIAKQYETGKGVKKDKQKAFKIYKLAARLGSTEGQVALARCYEHGIGTEYNIQHSMRWNIRAAMQDNTEATQALQKWFQQSGKQISFESQESMLTYAIIMLKQLDPEQDLHLDILLCIIGPKAIYQTSQVFDFFNKGQDPPDNAETFQTCKLAIEYDIRAVHWMVKHYQYSKNIVDDFAGLPEQLQKETVSEDAETAYCLARCHMLELGTPKHEAKAVDFYKRAAEDNYAAAQYELGNCYQDGTVVEQSIDKAIELYKKAAEQQYILALKALSDIYESDAHELKDLKQAFEYRKRAAELGDADEQLCVAECYKDGIGVKQNDREALCWFQKAAHNGKYKYYKYVAECYDKGIGTEIDQEAAFENYRKLAIALPTKENLIILAERLENGVGTQKDATAAIKYYQQAGAHSKLGDIYYDGNYVAMDYETALNYYKRVEELNLVQFLNVIHIFGYCQHLRGDGLYYFKVLKLAAHELRTENLNIEIIVW